MKKNFIPILTKKIRVRVIHECALYLNKYGKSMKFKTIMKHLLLKIMTINFE